MNDQTRRRPGITRRVVVAVGLGLAAAAYSMRLGLLMPHFGTDFDPIRFSARLLIHGENPYETLGPGLKHFWNFRLLYPLPAVLIGAPFLAVPILAARALFVGLAAATLGYSVTRFAWWPLISLASACFWSAAAYAQWSPWLVASAGMPVLGIFLAAKPNVGLAMLTVAEGTRALLTLVVGMIAITLLSFAVFPGWLGSWISAIHTAPHVRPLIMLSGGSVLLLAAAKWRRREARLLIALALLPQNPAIYEGLLLFVIPQDPIEALILATSSWFVEIIVTATGPHASFQDSATATGYAMLACLYVPCLFMIMRRRNEGRVPDWLEAAIARAPGWLRGSAATS